MLLILLSATFLKYIVKVLVESNADEVLYAFFVMQASMNKSLSVLVFLYQMVSFVK